MIEFMGAEKRFYEVRELRADDGSKGKVIEGHAVVFNQPTVIADSFIELISSDAFTGCDLSDVALFVNHDTNRLPLARTQSGTLTLTVDNVGLAIRAILDAENNPDAKALWHSIARGDLNSMSFAFTVADNGDEWKNLNSDMPTRIIHRFKKVYEVSGVSFPAYPQTDLQARARQMITNARKEKNEMPFEKMSFEEFMNLYKNTDDRTAAVNAYDGLLPNGEPIPAEYRDWIPYRYHPGNIRKGSYASPRFVQGKGFIPADEGNTRSLDATLEQRKQAGEALKKDTAVMSPYNAFGERRTMTMTSGGNESIVVPQYTGNKITTDFSTVSSLVDVVGHLSLNGGETFQQPFVTGIAPAAYSQEASNANEAETQFSFATINKAKITAYAELTEELEKLPAAAYADMVFDNIRTSIRQVLARDILWGKGVENDQPRITGIFSDRANAIDANTDIELSAITDTTLDEIVFSYGGLEDVEGNPSVLILNKADLLAFAKVRTSTKQKFYDIQFTGANSGRINGVNFIINSNCKSLMASTTVAGDYCMAYGNPANYTLCEFSPIELKKSDDYKFRSGISCFKGVVFCGGNITKKNGFLRISKK